MVRRVLATVHHAVSPSLLPSSEVPTLSGSKQRCMGEKHRGSEGNQRPDPVPPYAPEADLRRV
jgi:hypothetical protein